MIDTKEMIPVMKRRIDDISEILDVPPSAAQPLLRHHKWKKDRLLDSYTTDSEKEMKEAGVCFRCTNRTMNGNGNDNGNERGNLKSISESTSSFKSASTSACTSSAADCYCSICFDDELTAEEMYAMSCGHSFCVTCWSCHIKTKLQDGPASILATCPQDKCNELITEEEVAKITPDLLEKFQNFQLRNFVELSGTSRWCPGPGCDRIAAITGVNSTSLCDADSMIATCDKCTTCFCLKCGSEPHPPLRCKALDTWKEKCKNESETANWILANTKACPKCSSRIEKNQGCNHMTCQNCRYEFCWICCGDWKDHGANTGGYYNCNKFEEKDTEDRSDAANAKRELDRYLHYYKRYHAHAEAQKFAMKQLKDTGTKMMLLQECKGNATWSDVEFLKTANEQLVECRRVLKFTYVFAYYMTTPPTKAISPPVENPPKRGRNSKKVEKVEEEVTPSVEEINRKMQKDRFEYHQEMLERFTENLSEMVEKPLKEIDRTEVVNQVCLYCLVLFMVMLFMGIHNFLLYHFHSFLSFIHFHIICSLDAGGEELYEKNSRVC
jgi:ariadne-1